MKKLLIGLVMLMICGGVQAGELFPGIRSDHELHAAATFIGNDCMKTWFKWNGFERLIATTVIGVAKEYSDKNTEGKFEVSDIYANTVGFIVYEFVHVGIRW